MLNTVTLFSFSKGRNCESRASCLTWRPNIPRKERRSENSHRNTFNTDNCSLKTHTFWLKFVSVNWHIFITIWFWYTSWVIFVARDGCLAWKVYVGGGCNWDMGLRPIPVPISLVGLTFSFHMILKLDQYHKKPFNEMPQKRQQKCIGNCSDSHNRTFHIAQGCINTPIWSKGPVGARLQEASCLTWGETPGDCLFLRDWNWGA